MIEPKKIIKILIVEDSNVVRVYLEHIFSSDPQLKVIGKAKNGKEAIDFLEDHHPDIITMDIDMPIMNGLEATRHIMSSKPVPIIIVTASRNAKEVSLSMEALQSGALTLIEKPNGIGHPNQIKSTNYLIKMVKTYSEVKVIKRDNKSIKRNIDSDEKPYTSSVNTYKYYDKEILAIGSSSGGPQVLKIIFSSLNKDFPIPIVIVQHITSGFLGGMIKWLQQSCELTIKEAEHGEACSAGYIYFAPDFHQMTVRNNKIILIKCQEPNKDICPSVDYLFKGLSENHAEKTIAMLLTGMGNDGADAIGILNKKGALTIAQDKESSLVHGMPGVAIKQNAVQHVMNIEEITAFLAQVHNGSKYKTAIK